MISFYVAKMHAGPSETTIQYFIRDQVYNTLGKLLEMFSEIASSQAT